MNALAARSCRNDGTDTSANSKFLLGARPSTIRVNGRLFWCPRIDEFRGQNRPGIVVGRRWMPPTPSAFECIIQNQLDENLAIDFRNEFLTQPAKRKSMN
jgi:hypothetical protein